MFDAEPIPTISVGPTVENIDLRAAGIRTVIWATGHRRTYPWLQIPVLDADGELRQRRGVTPVPGLYVLGQRFQHFRSSNFIAPAAARRTLPTTSSPTGPQSHLELTVPMRIDQHHHVVAGSVLR